MSQIAAFQDIPQPGLVLGEAHVNWGAGVSHQRPNITFAEECVITHCAIDYNLTVSGGRANFDPVRTLYGLYRNVHSTQIPIPFHEYDYGLPGWSHVCWQAEPGDLTYTKEPVGFLPEVDNHEYMMKIAAVNYTYNAICPVAEQLKGISQGLTGYMFYNWTVPSETTGSLSDSGWSSDLGHAPWIEQWWWWDRNRPRVNTLGSTLERIAASLTKLNLDISNETVAGNATFPVVHVHVDWVWLSLPIVLELAGIVFLVAAIVLTKLRKAELWKSFVLPLLFHGLDEDIIQSKNRATDVYSMNTAAQGYEVRLGKAAREVNPDLQEDSSALKEAGRLLLRRTK